MDEKETIRESNDSGVLGRAGTSNRTPLEEQATVCEPGACGALSDTPPQIPAHRILRCIGEGAYGKIWLAVNAMGTYRAVKVVYRAHFKDERPYEREYEGIKRFEPIS